MEVFRALLKAGCITDTITDRGHTILHDVVKNSQPECVDALLEAGCNINMPTSYGSTALHLAAGRLDTKMMLLLAKAGCDVNVRDGDGHTALKVAEIWRQRKSRKVRHPRPSPHLKQDVTQNALKIWKGGERQHVLEARPLHQEMTLGVDKWG